MILQSCKGTTRLYRDLMGCGAGSADFKVCSLGFMPLMNATHERRIIMKPQHECHLKSSPYEAEIR